MSVNTKRVVTVVLPVLVLGTAALLGGPSAAAAADCGGQVPPANSQIDQYVESVPGDCGNDQVSRNPEKGGGEGGNDAVSSETAEQLEDLGPSGQAAAELAIANSPGPAGGGGSSDSSSGQPAVDVGSAQDAGAAADGAGGTQADPGDAGVPATATEDGGTALGALSALADAPDDDGGMGWILPVLLAVTVGIGVGYLVRRRRG
jgi:hypothetical protein